MEQNGLNQIIRKNWFRAFLGMLLLNFLSLFVTLYTLSNEVPPIVAAISTVISSLFLLAAYYFGYLGGGTRFLHIFMVFGAFSVIGSLAIFPHVLSQTTPDSWQILLSVIGIPFYCWFWLCTFRLWKANRQQQLEKAPKETLLEKPYSYNIWLFTLTLSFSWMVVKCLISPYGLYLYNDNYLQTVTCLTYSALLYYLLYVSACLYRNSKVLLGYLALSILCYCVYAVFVFSAQTFYWLETSHFVYLTISFIIESWFFAASFQIIKENDEYRREKKTREVSI